MRVLSLNREKNITYQSVERFSSGGSALPGIKRGRKIKKGKIKGSPEENEEVEELLEYLELEEAEEEFEEG